MIHAEFLQGFSLYRKQQFEVRKNLGQLDGTDFPPINMKCRNCSSVQTFIFTGLCVDQVVVSNNAKNPEIAIPLGNTTNAVWYSCARCRGGKYAFLLHISDNGKRIEKAGQYPSHSIDIDPDVDKGLGDYVETYKKALMCESHSFGIGAFSYYRRIVEGLIDELLDKIGELIGEGDEQESYRAKLEDVRVAKGASSKIHIIKDLLPPFLTVGGRNPLGVIYGALSQGLHSESDEVCLDLAAEIRVALAYLVGSVAHHLKSRKEFSASLDNIKRKLDKRANANEQASEQEA